MIDRSLLGRDDKVGERTKSMRFKVDKMTVEYDEALIHLVISTSGRNPMVVRSIKGLDNKVGVEMTM